MEYFSKSLDYLKSRFRSHKRQRTYHAKGKKIHIIRPAKVNSCSFYFPTTESLANPISAYENLINPSQNSTETIKSRLELIENTIIYAKKKLRKLSQENCFAKYEFPEEEAKNIYDDWYSQYSTSDIKSLAPGQEITTKVVNCYISLIPTNHSFVILPPFVYKSIENIYEKLNSEGLTSNGDKTPTAGSISTQIGSSVDVLLNY